MFGSRSFGNSFGALSDGWHEINMEQVLLLRAFGIDNNEIQVVHDVCYNSLLAAGDMIIETSATKRNLGDGSRLVLPNETEERKMHVRSVCFSEWARAGALLEDCIGWFPSSGVDDADGERKPVVMNVERMRILHKVDVYGQHEWRHFEVLEHNQRFMKETAADNELEFPGLREIFGVKVIGSSLPDTSGTLHSKVKRIMLGEWDLYQHKKRMTMDADAERAHPMIVTQSLDTGQGEDEATASAHPVYDQSAPILRNKREMRDDLRVIAMVKHHNTCSTASQENYMAASSSRSRGQQQSSAADERQYELGVGRQYVNAHLPEAPLDLGVSRQAFFESCCLAWSIPMSMLSSGDTSGKAKLNTASASPETARIFREAQADRKSRMEGNVRDMYQFIHQPENAEAYLRKQVARRFKRLSEKRKRDPDYEEMLYSGDEDKEGEDDDISVAAIERNTHIRVCIPGSGAREEIIELLNMGVLKYAAFCAYNSKQMGIPLESYNATQSMTDEAMQINGCAPKETAEGAPAKKKKK